MSNMGRCGVHGIAYTARIVNTGREEYCPECECDALRQSLTEAQMATGVAIAERNVALALLREMRRLIAEMPVGWMKPALARLDALLKDAQ